MDGPTIDSQWTTKGFNDRFEQLIKDGLTYQNAYLKCEEEHVALFGKLRYKTYDSFRDVRRDLIFKKTTEM